MRKLVSSLLWIVVVGLTGCGDTCTSKSVDAKTVGTCAGGAIAANKTVTIYVTVCSDCGDSSPTCRAEVVGETIELAPALMECQENSGCPAGGTPNCTLPVPCEFTAPASGSYTITTESGSGQTVTVSENGAEECRT